MVYCRIAFVDWPPDAVDRTTNSTPYSVADCSDPTTEYWWCADAYAFDWWDPPVSDASYADDAFLGCSAGDTTTFRVAHMPADSTRCSFDAD